VIKRTIEISAEAASLSVHLDQLQIRRDDRIVGSIPCEDIGVVVVDQPQTTYSHAALARLAELDAAIVICGRNHLPVGMLLPLADHSEVVWRLNDQLACSKPLQKKLWKQLVQAKIRAQANNLPDPSPARSKLMALSRHVRSGDPGNVEAHAARVYWARWAPQESGFRRDADGNGLNSLLNYGYRCMWVLVMFDLPVDTRKARKAYATFRKGLLQDGFTMLQFSVYARCCASEENTLVHILRVENGVPDNGEVRVLALTDKQFERMRIFWGKRRAPPAAVPQQLEFF
jgi:CRISPR-associated endonuclease Cas2